MTYKPTKHKRIKRILMKWTNYIYINKTIKRRQEQGLHDWDDDLAIINGLIEEYSTTIEDQIMSIYRRTVKNWDAVVDKESEDRRPMFNPYDNEEVINSSCS